MHLLSPPAYRRITAWAIFALGFYLLSGFLSLLLITFVLSFTMHSLVKRLRRRAVLSYRTLLTLLYLILIGTIVLFFLVMTPELKREWEVIKQRTTEFQQKHVPRFRTYLARYDFENNLGTVAEQAQGLVNSIFPYVTSLLKSTGKLLLNLVLSIFFSFIFLWDIEFFRRALPRLKTTRLDFVYEELAPHLIRYCTILGNVFQAQILVATANAVLTFFGLLLLSIPHVALLTIFVWILGLIPVIGVIISTIPIALLCLVEGGVGLMLKSIVLILAIHLVEAYILNPRIHGAVLKVHPVFMLVIIFLGEHFAGIFGIFLGIPLVLYFFQDLIRRPGNAPGETDAPAPETATAREGAA